MMQVDEVSRAGQELGISLRIVRDDLFAWAGGGNKARKLAAILHAEEFSECDAIVTCGGTQSNHARVAALAAAERRWPSVLVLHGDHASLDRPRGNLLQMVLAGAQIEIVSAGEIGPRMQAASDRLVRAGRRPAVIPGGGHLPSGAAAYAAAVTQLAEACAPERWIPDWIIVASGTGATHAGIHIGIERVGWPTRVVGISVARATFRGILAIEEMCVALRVKSKSGVARPVDFRDAWVGKGYEMADGRVRATIRNAASAYALVLDPTYTGKAFCALLDMISLGEIRPGQRVLFWHTGGQMNLAVSTVFDS